MIKKEEEVPVYSIGELQGSKKNFAAHKDFALYRFESFIKDIGQLKDSHSHDHFSVFFITEGEGQHLIDFETFMLRPQRIFLLSPGQVHSWVEFENMKGFVLFFSEDFFSAALQYQGLRDFLIYNTRQHYSFVDLDEKMFNYLEDIFGKIEEEQEHSRKYSKNIIRSSLNIILLQLTTLYEKMLSKEAVREGVSPKVMEFERLIEENYKTRKTAKEYAGLLFIAPNYLNALCQKDNGKSAGEMIRDRIMQEAKKLLTHSDMTVAEIAYDLNFVDNSYFGRFFKKYSGQTPIEFREQVRNFKKLQPLQPSTGHTG